MRPGALIRSLRPHQWVKNVFVLAAIVFSLAEGKHLPGERFEQVWNVVMALVAFCLGSSAIYVVNDVMDIESDRRHPTKRLRPIASGAVSVPVAFGQIGRAHV